MRKRKYRINGEAPVTFAALAKVNDADVMDVIKSLRVGEVEWLGHDQIVRVK